MIYIDMCFKKIGNQNMMPYLFYIKVLYVVKVANAL